MSAVRLVISDILHTRHGGANHPASHFLRRRGLSLWIDLDRLGQADAQSRIFSVDRFNLLAFHQVDHGPNFKSGKALRSLAAYVRETAKRVAPSVSIASVHLLTFPRILGAVFNPLSVYVGRDARGEDVFYIYEVRNTFGDMHSYIGLPNAAALMLEARKIFHVSPFFPVSGVYRLKVRVVDDRVSLVMRYFLNEKPALTAVLRGKSRALNGREIVRGLLQARQFPYRPIVSIHVEALKLWLKKIPFYPRPAPPPKWSRAVSLDEVE
jgi:DUF1365 family protein